MRLDRPIGTWLVLWPAMWALWIAGRGHPDGMRVALFALGALVMRSAGCVVNDIADRHIDPHVARTRDRPLAAGEISTAEAALLLFLLLAAAALLALLLDPPARWLAAAAAALAILYPFTKRWLPIPQLFLALAFAMAIPMAFIAECGRLPPIAWQLVAADLCWVVAYDTIYAMMDRDDDRRIGVGSTALLFGRWDRAAIGLLQAAALLLLATLDPPLPHPEAWWTAVALTALLFGWQQWLIRDRSRDGCMRAFLNNHPAGALLFLGLFFGGA
ncbi:MAG: 4-hydroxybenzoate octaprenyltransferase [Zetaproteobacteria bacterium]|nr:MAG: 4-hydroxybenzoate octaprenyltransferase [Zetaproteobacteria bacterium]